MKRQAPPDGWPTVFPPPHEVEYAPMDLDETSYEYSLPEEPDWQKTSQFLAACIADKHKEVLVHQYGRCTVKYEHHKGNIHDDGWVIYTHCRLQHPTLYFKFINNMLVDVHVGAINKDNEWQLDVQSCVSGNVLTSVRVDPKKKSV